MIEEITIKFGTELEPTQANCKLQLYKCRDGEVGVEENQEKICR